MINEPFYTLKRVHYLYHYTLKDLVLEDNETNDTTKAKTPLQVRQEVLKWDNDTIMCPLLQEQKVINLWTQHILPKFLDCEVSSSFKLNESNEKLYGVFWRNFQNILINTYKRYSKLIEIYESKENELLNQIKSSSISKGRTNLVPQTSTIDPYDESYANSSQVGETEASTDGMTIASRLKEIRAMWFSLYEEWCEEFNPLFTIIGDDDDDDSYPYWFN